jgi:hypothetical protein
MMIKRKSEFDKEIDLEAIEKEIPRDSEGNPTDEIEAPGVGSRVDGAAFATLPQHTPSKGAVITQLEMDKVSIDENMVGTDPRALENYSTAPCEAANIAMTPESESKWQSASTVAATLENTKGMNIARLPLEQRRQLAEIAEAMKDLPTPDAITFSDGRKRLIPSEVRDIPNKLAKQKSMMLLEKIIGTKLTAEVLLCARSSGVCFFQKPALWLAQVLAYELSKRAFYDNVAEIKDYNAEEDANNEAIAPQALARLFSWHVVEELQMLARIRQISLIHATKIMVERVCEVTKENKKPKDYSEKYDDAASLEQLLAS